MKKSILPPVIILLIAMIVGFILWPQRITGDTQLILTFHPVVGNQALVLNEVRYDNPAGEGRFKIRSFQFFISNIRLTGDTGEYVVPESYHLVRFDSANGQYVITLNKVPRQRYLEIEMGIGVDAPANGTITVSGDLDPNSRMAWSWDVGYKFVLFEGGLVLGDTQYPLVYHVGFDENYKIISTPLAADLFKENITRLDFQVDILRLFDGANRVDMSQLSNVKFDRKDAKQFADNFPFILTSLPPRAP